MANNNNTVESLVVVEETAATKLAAVRKLPRFAWETEVAYRLARNVDVSGFPTVLEKLGGPEAGTLLWVNKVRSDLASLASQAAEGGEIRVARKATKDGDVKFSLSNAKGETKECYATTINRMAKAVKAFADLVGCAPAAAFDAMESGTVFHDMKRNAGDWIQSKLEKASNP